MSVSKERRQVEADVSVVYCDGPNCTVSKVVDYSDPDRAPAGWWLLRKWRDYYAVSSKSDLVGPWHFHTLKCLAAWTADAQAQATPPVPPDKALTQ